ncbi:hypothetical protein [Acetobacter orientalis]|uniref:hypothetical protein n=1 Tax=Acetobacter orientalis TaxID=146474 RepID=UPI0039E89175
MKDICCPNIQEFNRNTVPEQACMRLLSYEERGILEDLTQALKRMRSCVFMCGNQALSDAEVIQLTQVPSGIFMRVLPRLLALGFMSRDDVGTLFSTRLYECVLRRREREARKTLAEQERAQWVEDAQANGENTQGLTPKQIASKLNGRKGGRPRKNSKTSEGQRNMPFYGVVAESENPSTKNKASRVIVGDPTGFVGSVEERNNTILNNNLSSSPSQSMEPENPKPDEAEVRLIARKAREAAGLGNGQRTFSETYVRNFLRDGIDAETILRIAAEKRGVAQKFVYLDIPVRDAFKAKLEANDLARAVLSAPDWQKNAKAAYAQACTLFAKEINEKGDFGRVQREWPDTADKHGLPPVERTLAAYEAHFKPQSEQVAA